MGGRLRRLESKQNGSSAPEKNPVASNLAEILSVHVPISVLPFSGRPTSFHGMTILLVIHNSLINIVSVRNILLCNVLLDHLLWKVLSHIVSTVGADVVK